MSKPTDPQRIRQSQEAARVFTEMLQASGLGSYEVLRWALGPWTRYAVQDGYSSNIWRRQTATGTVGPSLAAEADCSWSADDAFGVANSIEEAKEAVDKILLERGYSLRNT